LRSFDTMLSPWSFTILTSYDISTLRQDTVED